MLAGRRLSSWRSQLPGCSCFPQVPHSRTTLPPAVHQSHTCNHQRDSHLRCGIVSKVASRDCSSKTSSSDSDDSINNSVAASSTSIALRRKLQQLLDGAADPEQQWQQQQQQQSRYGTADEVGHNPAAAEAAGTMPAGSKARSKGGFGASGSIKSSKKQKQGSSQQQAAAVSPEAPCPCQSGLQYKACCLPFLSGVTYPASAYELVRARLTAMQTGNSTFLASTIHPDCNLALGGPRNMASRVKQQCAMFKRAKCGVVDVAHCPGDTEGSWVVLAILEGTTGEFKGVKIPHMEMVVRSSWREPPKSFAGSSSWGIGQQQQEQQHARSSRGDRSSDKWLFYKQTNQMPTNGEAEAIYRLLARHVPELLLDGNGQEGQGVAWRPVYFNWVTPNLGTSSSSGGWYLDLLTPAAEPLSSSRGGSSSSSARGGEQRLALVPRGVFVMDDYLEQRQARQ